MQAASVALDHYRFFFNNIWLPWDEVGQSEDWIDEHLHNRFELYQEFLQLGNKSRNWVKIQALKKEYESWNDELKSVNYYN